MTVVLCFEGVTDLLQLCVFAGCCQREDAKLLPIDTQMTVREVQVNIL